jgi:hypothetical protein
MTGKSDQGSDDEITNGEAHKWIRPLRRPNPAIIRVNELSKDLFGLVACSKRADFVLSDLRRAERNGNPLRGQPALPFY